jgi:hypothetical protein
MIEYNLTELRKNSTMLVKAFNECFRKLKEERELKKIKILEHRIEDNILIGDYVLSNLRELGEDDVLDNYCQIIKKMANIYQDYKKSSC